MSDDDHESRNRGLCLVGMIEFNEAVFCCGRNCVAFEAQRLEG